MLIIIISVRRNCVSLLFSTIKYILLSKQTKNVSLIPKETGYGNLALVRKFRNRHLKYRTLALAAPAKENQRSRSGLASFRRPFHNFQPAVLWGTMPCWSPMNDSIHIQVAIPVHCKTASWLACSFVICLFVGERHFYVGFLGFRSVRIHTEDFCRSLPSTVQVTWETLRERTHIRPPGVKTLWEAKPS